MDSGTLSPARTTPPLLRPAVLDRIEQVAIIERLLAEDGAYRALMGRVRYRLIPGVF